MDEVVVSPATLRARAIASAARQRRRYRRLNAGKLWLPIEPDEASLVVFLIDAGLLRPHEAEDRCAIKMAPARGEPSRWHLYY